MELSLILLKQVIVMLVYLGLGAIDYKCGLISVEGNKSISNWVLYIANPLLIFISFQQDFSVKLLKGLGMTIIFTIVGYLIFIPLAMLFIGKKENRETEIE
ncbi:MAG: AEC family transporter, partial [Oscillospiraceae bacterium]|nr:AEC family transporter [Oscillospiraceae bacterium]